jgi:GT2 family glycosyltransferase
MVPWLSVVMPVHRPTRWLADALASIAAQGEPKGAIEVIIRDSTPEGPAGEPIMARYAHALAIDYAHVPDMPGWTGKTNAMVAAARARHVCTLHQDDLWLPGRAGAMRALIARHPDAALLFGPARLIDPAGRDIGGWHPPFDPGIIPHLQFRERLLVQNTLAMPAPVFARAAYLGAGGLDETLWYTPDWELWLKLGDQGAVVFDRAATSAFRIHPAAQTMTRSRAELAQQLEAVLARHLPATARTARLSHASAAINIALAEAAAGDATAKWRALASLCRLGPVGAWRYLHYSRLAERLWPRLRLRLAGGL